jgi:hypothetical protein
VQNSRSALRNLGMSPLYSFPQVMFNWEPLKSENQGCVPGFDSGSRPSASKRSWRSLSCSSSSGRHLRSSLSFPLRRFLSRLSLSLSCLELRSRELDRDRDRFLSFLRSRPLSLSFSRFLRSSYLETVSARPPQVPGSLQTRERTRSWTKS